MIKKNTLSNLILEKIRNEEKENVPFIENIAMRESVVWGPHIFICDRLNYCASSVRVHSPFLPCLTRIMIATYLVYAYCLSVLAVRLTPMSIPSLSPFVVCNSRKRIILKQSVTTVLPSKSTVPSSSVFNVSSSIHPLNKQNVYFPWNDGYGLCSLFVHSSTRL